MKSVGYVLAVLAIGVSNYALAAKMVSPCESQAQQAFQQKRVELAMNTLVGNVGDSEATSQREGLERRWERDQAHCRHVARTLSSADASTVAL